MKAPVLISPRRISVDEYLRTSYRPDCDYVDGEVRERNLGEHEHSDLQSELLYYFRVRRKQWQLHAVVEQRVQVAARRFRIPDVCVVKGPVRFRRFSIDRLSSALRFYQRTTACLRRRKRSMITCDSVSPMCG